MTYTVLHYPPPPHQCPQPEGFNYGARIRCDECGQEWTFGGRYWWKPIPEPPPPRPNYALMKTRRG